ncbi:restriction endonuclease subunit S [Photobacterium leiognathi]|uniref:restriction endonuclease subunit S n=1 Tax=Photobacterium leiognathi TaxID=553611 RepID=UPI002980E9C3|nr:restriction endonuclease subunit S [Photobacterium leiognathi]
MTSAQQLITDNIDLWTGAIKAKSVSGRGTSSKRELYGIKKLRELILELAVRGKLVPQEVNDEPASVLLERIFVQKAELVKQKKIKNQKTLPSIDEDEAPFNLPYGWTWARLGDVTNYGSTIKVEAKDALSDTWVLELEDVEKVTSKLLKRVRFKDREFKSAKNRFSAGDVIYGKLRPYLDKVLVADEDGVCTTEMIPLRGYIGLKPEYLRLTMKCPYFIEYANESTHGMNLPRMGTDKARMALIPIMSESEQHRIVTKVNELMTLCDQLEQQTEASLDAHSTLVETLLATLTISADANELAANWARIAEHFDTLFTTEQSIDALKQTILQLAVMGKLVSQDPTDEPASALLERIAAEKAELVKQKIIKKQKVLPAISGEEKPFALPDGWKWCRLGEGLRLISDYHANGGYKTLKENVELLDDADYAIMLRTTNFSKKNYNNYKYITQDAYNFLEKSKLYPGDIIMNKIGDPGASFYVEDRGKPMSLAMNLFLLRAQIVDSQYVFFYLSGNYDYIRSFANGTSTQTITKDAVANLVFPLPPFEEQHRIVAKVHQLTALCDQLKLRLNQVQQTQLNLADAIVELHVY